MRAYISKAKSVAPLLSRFAAGQLALQFFNVVNGFFLLRWLSIEEQAFFSIAFSIQTLLTSLSDMGFSGSIVALVGNRYSEQGVLKSVLLAAKRHRNIFFLFGLVVCCLVYPLVTKNQSWNNYQFWINMLPVILAAYSQADMSIYSAPLMIHKKISELYLPQVGNSALRLLVNYLLFITGKISSFTTLLVNAVLLLLNSIAFKRKAAVFLREERNTMEEEAARKQMLRYLAPLIPGLLFNSIYGQLQVFIITFFGKTNNIAEVAALGRLSQVFVLLSAFNSVIVGPYIAKAYSGGLFKKYMLIASAASLIALCMIATSLLVPQVYLWLLGDKYVHLKNEILLLVAAASINFVSGVLWVMNSSRKWIFWWGSWIYIVLVVASQILGLFLFDLSETHGVLQLSFITTIAILLIHLITAFFGFRKDRKLHLS